MLLICYCLPQRRALSTAPEPPPFPTFRVTWAEGLHICGEQAGLAAVLGVLTHPHAAGLVGEHLLTHRGPLALSGVAPAASRVEKAISIFQPSPPPITASSSARRMTLATRIDTTRCVRAVWESQGGLNSALAHLLFGPRPLAHPVPQFSP